MSCTVLPKSLGERERERESKNGCFSLLFVALFGMLHRRMRCSWGLAKKTLSIKWVLQVRCSECFIYLVHYIIPEVCYVSAEPSCLSQSPSSRMTTIVTWQKSCMAMRVLLEDYLFSKTHFCKARSSLYSAFTLCFISQLIL